MLAGTGQQSIDEAGDDVARNDVVETSRCWGRRSARSRRKTETGADDDRGVANGLGWEKQITKRRNCY